MSGWKREANAFLNFLLSPLWEAAEWERDFPNLSQQKKAEITGELGYGLLEIALDASLTADQKRERILEATHSFVEQRLFNQLFPMDAGTGKLRAPRYTTDDGKSILFKFAPQNMLQLMGKHSSPLWSVQTHQVASATSPMQFLSLNGTSATEGLLNDLQAHIAPSFKATDIVLSGDEARLLIKQYDLLYSLASLENLQDYENRYQATDRSENPLHTDIRFMAEPNPYLQGLTYQAPPPPPVPVCKEGHDIEEALGEGREYCPYCATAGKKTYIVPGKKLCPECNQAIPEDSLRCPIDGYKFILPKLKCWGCQTLGKTPVRVVEYKDVERKHPKESFCPTCNSQWANQCPYCHAALDNLTMCTRTEECINDDRVILQCANCECPVRPDAKECPRCYEKLIECPACKSRGEPKRMLIASMTECPACRTAVAKV